MKSPAIALALACFLALATHRAAALFDGVAQEDNIIIEAP